jgi:hypothetical protein
MPHRNEQHMLFELTACDECEPPRRLGVKLENTTDCGIGPSIVGKLSGWPEVRESIK